VISQRFMPRRARLARSQLNGAQSQLTKGLVVVIVIIHSFHASHTILIFAASRRCRVHFVGVMVATRARRSVALLPRLLMFLCACFRVAVPINPSKWAHFFILL
jgi:hypothetical protein